MGFAIGSRRGAAPAPALWAGFQSSLDKDRGSQQIGYTNVVIVGNDLSSNSSGTTSIPEVVPNNLIQWSAQRVSCLLRIPAPFNSGDRNY